MDDIIKQEEELVNQIEGLKDDIEAIQQPRSDFALEHFVVGMHDTPGRQRMQAVLELQIKMFNIRRTQLEEKKIRVLIRQQQKILASWKSKEEKELAAIEIERMETDLAEMNLARLGNIREANCLLAILDKLPKKSYEELQKEESTYWMKRLARQSLTDMRVMGTIGAGNVEAIMQLFRVLGVESPALDERALSAFAEIGLKELSLGEKIELGEPIRKEN